MDPITALVILAALLLLCLAVYLFVMLWPLLVAVASVLVVFWVLTHLL